MSAVLSPDRILKELTELWVSLGREGHDESGAGVLRACSMTLVVLTEEADDIQRLGETLAALMPEHPSRTIVVRLRPDNNRDLSGRVYAQCWMPFGQRRQICCEQIEITASDAALADLPAVVLPLAAADLPTVLWCRAPRVLGMPEFREIASMAGKVVLDTSALPDAKAALKRLSDAAGRGVLLGDLAWTRLTRWREMLSQVFENRERLAQLPGISRVRVLYSGSYETAAWYLAAWLADTLQGAGAKASAAITSGEGPLRIELEGSGLRVALERQDGRLVVMVNEISQCTSLPPPSEYLVMREELGIVRTDPVFERTLASAARLAYATD
jgi:glucose-6-phosphate dehydrogenase assembly protein OpcA